MFSVALAVLAVSGCAVAAVYAQETASLSVAAHNAVLF
ncbi:MAG: hypothetical protein LBG43_06330 [Treponema sp.]|nr:hypothetical protein [Treponema sp.]